jgi:hypothetical protein
VPDYGRPGRGTFCPLRASNIAALAHTKENVVSITTIILVVVVLMLMGVLPLWPHARRWGYGPSGAAGAVLVIMTLLIVLGRS